MALEFEWDAAKAERNRRKHGVTFDEAMTVFGDPHAATYADPDHSTDEERELTIGYSLAGRLVLVAYAQHGLAIRIISARIATSHERRDFERR